MCFESVQTVDESVDNGLINKLNKTKTKTKIAELISTQLDILVNSNTQG